MDNKSCIFICLKYTLISFLLVDLINSLIAGVAILSEIDGQNEPAEPKLPEKNNNLITTTTTTTMTPESVSEETTVAVNETLSLESSANSSINYQVKQMVPTSPRELVIYGIFQISIVFFTIMGLVGVASEHFGLSLLTAFVMVAEGTLGLYVHLNVLTVVFNFIIAVFALLYAATIKLIRDSMLINRVAPVTSTINYRENLSTPPVMVTNINGSNSSPEK